MMNFDEFKEYIQENIKDYLPARYESATISIDRVAKNNDVMLDGIRIFDPSTVISPVIYINGAYEQYQEGRDIDDIVGSLADTFIDSRTKEPVIDVGNLQDYEAVKDHIVCRLVNGESNAQRLSNAPYTPMEDLAVSYHILVSKEEDGIGSIMITNSLMEGYGVDVETLHNQAMENMPKLMPMEFKSLNAVMMEMMTPQFMNDYGVGEEQAQEMMSDMFPTQIGPEVYCLTCDSKINGAACVINPEVQKYVSEQVGGDFFILPSSVHEVLVIGKSEDMSFEELQDMVQEVNQNVVSADEILSDHVYQYDARTHQISRADMAQNISHQMAAVQENTQTYDVGEKKETIEPEVQKHSTPKTLENQGGQTMSEQKVTDEVITVTTKEQLRDVLTQEVTEGKMVSLVVEVNADE